MSSFFSAHVWNCNMGICPHHVLLWYESADEQTNYWLIALISFCELKNPLCPLSISPTFCFPNTWHSCTCACTKQVFCSPFSLKVVLLQHSETLLQAKYRKCKCKCHWVQRRCHIPFWPFDMDWKYWNVMDAAIKPCFDPQVSLFICFGFDKAHPLDPEQTCTTNFFPPPPILLLPSISAYSILMGACVCLGTGCCKRAYARLHRQIPCSRLVNMFTCISLMSPNRSWSVLLPS